MKYLYLPLFLCLFLTPSFAQQDFRLGYIVRGGDTLQGYVDYRGAIRNSKIATFKASDNGVAHTYSPDEIVAYGFKNEKKVYESWQVPTPDRKRYEHLFLHVLVKGKVSIYTYRDDNDSDRFFLSKDGADLVELVEQVYTRADPKTGKRYRVVDRPFIGVIASAFLDCSSLTENHLENVMLRHSSLIKVATAYNECFDSSQFTHEPKKATVTLMPIVAFTLPSLHVSGSHYYARGDYRSTGLGLGGAIAMQVANPSMSEKLSLIVELLYAPYRFEGTVEGTYKVVLFPMICFLI
ncbi:hypothetical protein [Pontibacter virosus]|uniref:Uncharacterized protein n=1 Tax=Pontibacter virosus TaxID=1765052 RepID=A0A2U1B2R2_9BACT|nr:hypothetical protein [Pontibacter virosus]PVY42965.1 hypothetical protein C8E01_102141 [Pontibacter virosus]